MPLLALAAIWNGVQYLQRDALKADVARLETEKATLEAQRQQAIRVAVANADEVKRVKAQADQDLADQARHYEAKLDDRLKTVIILEEIARAPATDNGPVAPVLANAFEWLRQQQIAPGPDHRNEGDPADGAGRLSDLRTGTADPAEGPNQGPERSGAAVDSGGPGGPGLPQGSGGDTGVEPAGDTTITTWAGWLPPCVPCTQII